MTDDHDERTTVSRLDAFSADSEPARRRFLRGAGVLSIAALAGCSAPDQSDPADGDPADGDDGEPSNGSSDRSEGESDERSSGIEAVETDEITAANTAFEPVLARIGTGDSITWTVEEGVHTITAYHPDNGASLRIPEDAAPFDSDVMEEGETFTHEFDVEGVYDYYCVPHEGSGMIASVIVGDPDPEGDEPGLGDPADDVGDPETISELNAAAIEALGGEPPDPGDDSGDRTDGDEASDEDEESDGDDGSAGDAAEVSIPGREFSPDLLGVSVGDTVRWTFGDDAHTVTAYEDRIPAGADPFDSGLRNEGDAFEVTFDAEGVYDYYCAPHAGRGMVGSVIVGDPDPEGDEPGLSEPERDGEEGSALESLNARARERLAGSDDGEYATIDAGALDDADGEIDIEVATDDGTVRPGGRAPIVARYEGDRLANAPVDVEGDFQGDTDENGEFEITVPRDLEPGDECRIEIRVGGARGRVEVPVEG